MIDRTPDRQPEHVHLGPPPVARVKSRQTDDVFLDYLLRAPVAHAVFRAREARAVRKWALETPVLDLGCGFGEFAGVFFASRVDVGIDISEPDVQVAMASGQYRSLMRGDARRLPLPDASIGSVISISVLEHIPSLPEVFVEAFRVLRPRGLFVYTVPTPELNRRFAMPSALRRVGLGVVAGNYDRLYDRLFQHVSVHTVEGWRKLASDAGFEVVTVEGTLSQRAQRLFEALLPVAVPSQVAKTVLGRRLRLSPAWSRRLIRNALAGTVAEPADTAANILVVARKPAA
jgi:SAM-dependent methyltransferase